MMLVSRNLSLWEDKGKDKIPPQDIVQAVCLNNCHDRGQCFEGEEMSIFSNPCFHVSFISFSCYGIIITLTL